MGGHVSRWRNQEAWDERLASDARLIAERATVEQRALLDELPIAIEERFHVQFLLVIGSRARGNNRPDSDLDVYVEAVGIPDDPDRAPALSNGGVDVMVVPSGVLMRNVPVGEEFATRVVDEALISYDAGPYREVVIELDERGALPP